MIFSYKNMYHYAFALALITFAGYFGKQIQQNFDTKERDEYEMIKKYLLNDSPLYGYNKPKIWIHSKYEINARKWRDFGSPNTTDLNQPYLHLTIKSIINHCGNDFHICLIDDETFSKLIPSWDIDLSTVAEPMKSHFREMAMMQLVYFYGGMVVPNSFLCTKNLIDLYKEGTSNNLPFVCEQLNRTVNMSRQNHKLLFIPDIIFMGSEKNNETILKLIEYLKKRNLSPHFSCESDFKGEISYLCIEAINNQQMNLIGGEMVGIKNNKHKPILLEDLMEENFLDLSPNAYGIYIPQDEVLKRTKYQWFAVLTGEQIMESNMILSKYIKASIVDGSNEYKQSTQLKSVIAI